MQMVMVEILVLVAVVIAMFTFEFVDTLMNLPRKILFTLDRWSLKTLAVGCDWLAILQDGRPTPIREWIAFWFFYIITLPLLFWVNYRKVYRVGSFGFPRQQVQLSAWAKSVRQPEPVDWMHEGF